jgi:hypothetical protein
MIPARQNGDRRFSRDQRRRTLAAIVVVSPVIAPIIPPIVVSPVMAVVTTDVLTVNPCVMVMRPMPRHPNHLPVIIPVCSAAIVRLISDLYADPACTCDRWSKSGGNNHGRD